ncbi:hypothetical protein QBZ16_002977 [Prototheca wickerhamii]|uniref:Uncharacterized protein n=1 Tax=Prototheca wickerhamii TaxID=3111 RepID=A0AAD9IKH3_PROWI|nr:hypothetical protein QBZ16_002977 [Prototheca wickerhamii]
MEGLEDETEVLPARFNGYRRSGAYTPFELIDYCEDGLRHEIKMVVDAPIEKCFAIWSDRLNWLQWFDMIEEVGFHEDDPGLVSAFYMYRWAKSPFLELYTTFRRTEEEPLVHILEEPVEGTPLVVAALFARAAAPDHDPAQQTVVTLRVSYLLATVLKEYAGELAVYADVQEKLKRSMERMAAFVEQVDEEELRRLRGEDKEMIAREFPKQRRRRQFREKVDAARHAEFRKVQEAVRRGDLANALDPEVALEEEEDLDVPVELDDADEP